MAKTYNIDVGGVTNTVTVEATGTNSYNVTLNDIVYACTATEVASDDDEDEVENDIVEDTPEDENDSEDESS